MSIPLRYGHDGDAAHRQVSVKRKRRVDVSREGGRCAFCLRLDIHAETTAARTPRLGGEKIPLDTPQHALRNAINAQCRGIRHAMRAVYRFDRLSLSPYAPAQFREEVTPLPDTDAFWPDAGITFCAA